MKWLARLIFKLRPRRAPDFLIGPSKDDPYMRRWWIIPRNRFFNIYLHHIRHDDDDRAPHDHPWASLSLCLAGKILEWQRVSHNHTRTRLIKAGDWKYRSSTYAHRLTLPEGEAWTLFITGPTRRIWGFHCPQGWIAWREFVDPDDPGKPGRGCGETSTGKDTP